MSSRPVNAVRKTLRAAGCFISVGTLSIGLASLSAQDDGPVTNDPVTDEPPAEAAPELDPPERTVIDLTVTVPRGDVNESNARECEDRADAASISGDIIVCRRLGEDGSNYYSGSRKDAQKRVAEETAFANAPRTPEAFGIPNHGNPIAFGSVPPPALIIDVEALPEAPPGSDADRIARGLPPLGDRELTEEEEKARREALGLGNPD